MTLRLSLISRAIFWILTEWRETAIFQTALFKGSRAFEWAPYCMVWTTFENLTPRLVKCPTLNNFFKYFLWENLGQEKNFGLFGVSLRRLYSFKSQKPVSTNQRPWKSFKGKIQKTIRWYNLYASKKPSKIFQPSRAKTIEDFFNKLSKGGFVCHAPKSRNPFWPIRTSNLTPSTYAGKNFNKVQNSKFLIEKTFHLGRACHSS